MRLKYLYKSKKSQVTSFKRLFNERLFTLYRKKSPELVSATAGKKKKKVSSLPGHIL